MRHNYKRLSYILMLALFLLSSVAAYAQQAKTRAGNRFSSANNRHSSSEEEDEDLIKPTRPGAANPAEFQKPGILQIEYGYDGNFRAEEFRSQQTAPLTVRFAPIERLLFDFSIDTVISEKDQTGMSETGVGDIRAGIQFLALKDMTRHPALAFAFYTKLPTASSEKNLGTGRTDYRAVVLLSKKIGKTDLDFNAAYLNVGREFGDRRASGGQAAFGVTRELKNNFGIIAELSGQSEDDVQPKGIYALGALTYKINKRFQFDTGLRFGLNPAAPRIGFLAGFTAAVGNPFRK